MSEAADAAGKIENYLLELRAALGSTPPTTLDEILSDIRSHIMARLDDEADDSAARVDRILDALGAPRQLATAYRQEGLMARASVASAPWVMLRATFHWALTGIGGFLAFLVLMVGYSLGLSFLLCAALKPVIPEQVGLWIGKDGNGLELGIRPGADLIPNGTDLLGFWIVPVGLFLGAGCLILTTRFVRGLIRRHLRSGHDLPGRAA